MIVPTMLDWESLTGDDLAVDAAALNAQIEALRFQMNPPYAKIVNFAQDDVSIGTADAAGYTILLPEVLYDNDNMTGIENEIRFTTPGLYLITGALTCYVPAATSNRSRRLSVKDADTFALLMSDESPSSIGGTLEANMTCSTVVRREAGEGMIMSLWHNNVNSLSINGDALPVTCMSALWVGE